MADERRRTEEDNWFSKGLIDDPNNPIPPEWYPDYTHPIIPTLRTSDQLVYPDLDPELISEKAKRGRPPKTIPPVSVIYHQPKPDRDPSSDSTVSYID